MKNTKLLTRILLSLLFSAQSWAVIILDSTYKKSGFIAAEQLALLPQFASLIFIEGDTSDPVGSEAMRSSLAAQQDLNSLAISLEIFVRYANRC